MEPGHSMVLQWKGLLSTANVGRSPREYFCDCSSAYMHVEVSDKLVKMYVLLLPLKFCLILLTHTILCLRLAVYKFVLERCIYSNCTACSFSLSIPSAIFNASNQS